MPVLYLSFLSLFPPFSLYSLKLNIIHSITNNNNRGWEVECTSSESSVLTTQIYRVSESETGSLVSLDTPSTTMQNQFLGFFILF